MTTDSIDHLDEKQDFAHVDEHVDEVVPATDYTPEEERKLLWKLGECSFQEPG
jgi:hypothetical protein